MKIFNALTKQSVFRIKNQMVLSVSLNKFISEIMLCKLLSKVRLRIVLVSRNKYLRVSNNLSISNNWFCDALYFFKSKIVL